MNKYLEQICIEKQAVVGTAIATHLLQNLGSKVGLTSKAGGKYIGGGFAHGWHGMKEGRMGALKDALVGIASPDTLIAKNKMADAARGLHLSYPTLGKREQVGLRMLSQGRFSDLQKYKLNKSPAVQSAASKIDSHLGNDVATKALSDQTTHSRLEKVWKSPDHPLLSNVASNLSKGKVGPNSVKGTVNNKPGIIGSVAAFAAEPVMGAINMAKHVSSTTYANTNKYLKGAKDKLEKTFITDPAKKGWAMGNKYTKGLKSRVSELAVNPTSEYIKRTSSALSDIAK